MNIESQGSDPFLLREALAEDMTWVVQRHRELYVQEYGWGETFARLVEQSAENFVRDFDAACERGWIAERDGQPVGCVFLTRGPEAGVAKLRLLLVDPAARGLGIGAALVDACIAFAREAGYRRITLFTNELLHAARRIYADRGFRCVAVERQDHVFGHPFVAETWELEL
ncbi:MAG TPA: GNAT family N-acetyltransferase [Longimicrobium sp.]|nr:GNAT family N-acetyltransferase [Longimicrobium sp.]